MFKSFKKSSLIIKHWFWISAFLIILLAFFLRFYRLGQVPISLYWDEIAMLVDAKAVAETGKDMHGNRWLQPIFLSYGDYKLPVYIWLTSVAVKMFGANEWSLRLPSAVAGVTHVIIIGLLAREIGKWDNWKMGDNKKSVLGKVKTFFSELSLFKFKNQSSERLLANASSQLFTLSSMFILAISPWSILFSRTGFEGHVGQMLMALSVFFMYRTRTWKGNYIISALFGALAVYSYYSVRFVWPVVFCTFLFIEFMPKLYSRFIHREVNKKHKFQGLSSKFQKFSPKDTKSNFPIVPFSKLSFVILAFILWLILLLPMYRSDFYSASQTFRLSTTSILNTDEWVMRSNIYREIAGNGIISRVFYHRYVITFRELLQNYADHLDLNYLFVHGDENLRHSTGKVGLLVLGFAPFLLLGIYGLARQKLGVLLLLIVWWMIALLPASVPQDTPHALRSLNGLTPLVLVTGFGVMYLLRHFLFTSVVKIKYTLGISIILLTLVISMQTGLFLHDYFKHYEHRSAGEWQSGYESLATVIAARKDEVRTVWVNPGDDRFYLWQMIYGGYAGEDYQKLEYKGFQPKTIENIEFSSFNWGTLNTLDHKILVVETPGRLQGEPVVKYQIRDWMGKLLFEVGEYGN